MLSIAKEYVHHRFLQQLLTYLLNLSLSSRQVTIDFHSKGLQEPLDKCWHVLYSPDLKTATIIRKGKALLEIPIAHESTNEAKEKDDKQEKNQKRKEEQSLISNEAEKEGASKKKKARKATIALAEKEGEGKVE